MLLSPFARVSFAERLKTYMTLLTHHYTPENPAEKYARAQQVRVKLNYLDISCGIPMVCSECPIARALNRMLKDGFKALVGPTVIAIVKDSDREFHYPLPTPGTARHFIYTFDRYQEVDPIDFPLEIPEAMLKDGFLNSRETTPNANLSPVSQFL